MHNMAASGLQSILSSSTVTARHGRQRRHYVPNTTSWTVSDGFSPNWNLQKWTYHISVSKGQSWRWRQNKICWKQHLAGGGEYSSRRLVSRSEFIVPVYLTVLLHMMKRHWCDSTPCVVALLISISGSPSRSFRRSMTRFHSTSFAILFGNSFPPWIIAQIGNW